MRRQYQQNQRQQQRETISDDEVKFMPLSSTTSPVRFAEGPSLDLDSAYWLGYGLGRWLRQSDGTHPMKVGIGRDSRLSGQILTAWLAGGLQAAGVEAIDLGLCTTPSVFYACQQSHPTTTSTNTNTNTHDEEIANEIFIPVYAGVCVTASHLPSQWNGFKIFTRNTPTGIGQEGIDQIIDTLEDYEKMIKKEEIQPVPASYLPRQAYLPVYEHFLRDTFLDQIDPKRVLSKDDQCNILQGWKIVVNAGNGAGGFLAHCLKALGADTSSSLHLKPDGTFPNHIPNPDDSQAMAATVKAVLDSQAHLGICLDTDADRVGLVDGDGLPFHQNELIALCAKIALSLEEGEEQLVVVTDSVTSLGLERYLRDELHMKHFRYRKGSRYVIEKARSMEAAGGIDGDGQGKAVLAMECSGHSAWPKNGWVDDGCYTAIQVIAHLVHSSKGQQGGGRKKKLLRELVEGLSQPAESQELRCKVNKKNTLEKNKEVMQCAIETFRQFLSHSSTTTYSSSSSNWKIEPVNYEGIRASYRDTAWCLLRSSLHEPILSITLESELEGGLKLMVKDLLDIFTPLAEEIDLSPLRAVL
eukprot:scaffold7567_cov167-Ochromonas_danica.AAC.1